MALTSGKQPRCSRFQGCVAVCASLAALTGCAFNGNFLALLSDQQQPCVLSASSNQHEIVEHLNANIAPLRSWRSTDVKIVPHGQGAIIGLRLSARIAVEQPRNFRLMVSAMSNPEADLGSNSERSWFWMRRGPPNVFTVRHDEIGNVRSAFPFDPQWVTEVLGVVALNEDELKMYPPKQERGPIRLVADRQLPGGRRVRREMVVDSCRGTITSHELYDASDKLVARADLKDYRAETAHGIAMPHEIKLDWPQFGFGLTMTLGEIEINPTDIAAEMWAMPKHKGYPPLDLARAAAGPQRGGPQGTRPPRIGNDEPPFRDDFDPGKTAAADDAVRPAGGEADWVPPTVRDDGRLPRPPASQQSTPLKVPPKSRTWWQRLMGR